MTDNQQTYRRREIYNEYRGTTEKVVENMLYQWQGGNIMGEKCEEVGERIVGKGRCTG